MNLNSLKKTEGVAGAFPNLPLPPNPDAEIKALRERVAILKKEAQLLLERFQRREISAAEARAEAARLGREVFDGERRVDQWEVQHSPTKP